MRKPTGDQNMRTLNLNHGVNISDAFMEVIERCMKDGDASDDWELINPANGEVVEVVSAKYLWQKILDLRMQTGEPYLIFIDTANRALPSWLDDKGLQINGSNLCTEIFLPTSADRTAVCCLSSLNLEYYDDWKDDDSLFQMLWKCLITFFSILSIMLLTIFAVLFVLLPLRGLLDWAL
jgi:ribonucleoside-diphosphate reductase alpha chain